MMQIPKEVSKQSAEANKKKRELKKLKQEAREQSKERIASDEDEIQDEIENEDWKDILLQRLIKISPHDFERLCQLVLRESGFTKVEVTGRVGDGGIDGIGILRVNLISFHVSFQCKRYQGSVGSAQIRDFRGAFVGRGDKGLFITTGTFTPDARKEAIRDGAPAIDLIDGRDLCDLLKSLKIGVDVEQIEKITINEDWFSKF
jgi:restriction system protein